MWSIRADKSLEDKSEFYRQKTSIWRQGKCDVSLEEIVLQARKTISALEGQTSA